MSEKIMILVGQLTVPVAEFEQQQTAEGAEFFAGVPGLRWKIWLLNRERGEAGGIKLFADEEAFNAYVNGPIMADLIQYPLWTDVKVMTFDYMLAQSAITRAPVGDRAMGLDSRPLTFGRMAEAAFQAVPSIKPTEAHRRMEQQPELLVIDVRDAADIAQTGTLPGAVNISYGALTYMADHEAPESWRDSRLADHTRPILTTCILGPLGALGGKLLHDMGFSNVSILDGGVQGWQEAGFTLQTFPN